MPNFTAHSKADVKHSDMFLDVLEKYVAPGREQDVLPTATDSMDIHRVYFAGMAEAMEKNILTLRQIQHSTGMTTTAAWKKGGNLLRFDDRSS